MWAYMQHSGGFPGARQIVRYNWTKYAASFAVIAAACVVWLSSAPSWLNILAAAAALPAAWWSVASVVASAHVYDYFGMTRWKWLIERIDPPAKRWVLIHAGLDDASDVFAAVWPQVQGVVLDVYHPRRMTEPSIDRARRDQLAPSPFIKADFANLPVDDEQADTIFLLLAAHELRTSDDRRALLREAKRITRAGGSLVLVEHLRNCANFAAYGPGFTHFHSRRTWLADCDAAGWQLEDEQSATPFVRLFTFRRMS